MAQQDMREGTTRVVNINKNYGGKGQFIRLANIENGCVKWLIFGMPKMQKPQGMGGGGGMSKPMGIQSPIHATVWLVCGASAVEQILAGAKAEQYKDIIASLKEALLMQAINPVDVEKKRKAIENALKVYGTGDIKFEHTSAQETVTWWEQNFGFLYDKSVWEMAHQSVTAP